MVEPPLIINNFGDVSVFESVEKAERYLEAIDVEDNQYVGYDSKGRLLELSTRANRVVIGVAESTPTHQEATRQLLIEKLDGLVTSAGELPGASLQDLVRMSQAYTKE